MGIMLGNLTVDKIEKRLQITLTEQHKKELLESRQLKAENIESGKWHCFDIPFYMVCGDKATAEKWRDIFMTYDLSNAERFGITWEGGCLGIRFKRRRAYGLKDYRSLFRQT